VGDEGGGFTCLESDCTWGFDDVMKFNLQGVNEGDAERVWVILGIQQPVRTLIDLNALTVLPVLTFHSSLPCFGTPSLSEDYQGPGEYVCRL
jgi:hypothetical protein